MKPTRLFVATLLAVATLPIACGDGSDSTGLLPTGVGPRGSSTFEDAGGAVPGQSPLLVDGGVNPLYCSTGLTECNSACVDVATDKNNCGSCGATCDGTCAIGHCALTLATGGTGQAIAVSATSVYFSSPAGLMSVPIGGGTAASLAPKANGAIAVDAKNVYYSTAEGVMSIPLGGGAPTRLGVYAAAGITSNGEGVCWTAVNGFVESAPIPLAAAASLADAGADDGGDGGGVAEGPPPTTLAISDDYPTGVFASSSALFWTTNGTLSSGGGFTALSGTVMRFAFADLTTDGGVEDGGVATVATGQNDPLYVTADTANVYWTAAGTLGNSYADGAVMKAPVLGGAPVALASGQAFPYGIAADSSNVYWSNNDNGGSAGALYRVPIAGGTPVKLVTGLTAPTFVAVDATSVYFTTTGGLVVKVTPK